MQDLPSRRAEALANNIVPFSLIVCLATLLYAPFFGNAIVFDDHNLFTNGTVFSYAQTPLTLANRHFPYFTLGFIQVVFNSIEANRIFSLLLHIGCTWMIFILVGELLRATSNLTHASGVDNQRIKMLALLSALFFALNPVAVYGAGYLVQRTILFATLFSLLSLWCYHRALSENRFSCIITAALFYSAAVFSKEHAIMLPIAVAALTPIYRVKFPVRNAAAYLLLCMPAGITVYFLAKGAVGHLYEPNAEIILDQLNLPYANWFSSIAIQAKLFFDYLYYWIVPDIRTLSADIRIDFLKLLNPISLGPALLAYFLVPVIAINCIYKRNRFALFGAGLFYSWALSLTEFVTIRFQEPFVLYRSYLWAPGYAFMLAALLIGVNWKALRWIAGIMLSIFFFLAQNRLQSLSDDFALWRDAATKLSSNELPGAYRIYYNVAKGYLAQKRTDLAMHNYNLCITNNPRAYQGYLGRGLTYLRMDKPDEALAALNFGMTLKPPKDAYAQIQYYRAVALDLLGEKDKAVSALILSAENGNIAALIKINKLQGKDTILFQK